MKQECPTYHKSIGNSKALVATFSDTKLELDSDDSDQGGIVSTFTANIDSPKEAKELVMRKKSLWNPSLRKWTNKMKSILSTQSCTRFLRNMKSFTS